MRPVTMILLLLPALLPNQLGCGNSSSSPSGDIAAQAARRRQLVAKRTTRTTVVIPQRPSYAQPPSAVPQADE